MTRKEVILLFWTSGPNWSPEGHSGVSAGGGDSAGSEGDHRPGWGEAVGGGQPSVWLRLAGNAQPCHTKGKKKTWCKAAKIADSFLRHNCRGRRWCEQNFYSNKINLSFQVMEAEQARTRSEAEHRKTAANYNSCISHMRQLEKKLKRSINKSRS